MPKCFFVRNLYTCGHLGPQYENHHRKCDRDCTITPGKYKENKIEAMCPACIAASNNSGGGYSSYGTTSSSNRGLGTPGYGSGSASHGASSRSGTTRSQSSKRGFKRYLGGWA